MKTAIIANTFYDALKSAGVKVPELCHRIVIDAIVGEVVSIDFECHASEEVAMGLSEYMQGGYSLRPGLNWGLV